MIFLHDEERGVFSFQLGLTGQKHTETILDIKLLLTLMELRIVAGQINEASFFAHKVELRAYFSILKMRLTHHLK